MAIIPYSPISGPGGNAPFRLRRVRICTGAWGNRLRKGLREVRAAPQLFPHRPAAFYRQGCGNADTQTCPSDDGQSQPAVRITYKPGPLAALPARRPIHRDALLDFRLPRGEMGPPKVEHAMPSSRSPSGVLHTTKAAPGPQTFRT